MKIEIHLYASLATYLPEDAKNKLCIMELPDDFIVDDLIEELKLPVKSVKLIFINGVHADRATKLKDGDRVGIFPPVGGG